MGTPQGISISLTKLTIIVWDDLCKKEHEILLLLQNDTP